MFNKISNRRLRSAHLIVALLIAGVCARRIRAVW